MQAYYPNTPTPQQIKPITCPRCGSRELAFVTEYHKATCCRIFSMIIAALFTFLSALLIYQFLEDPLNLPSDIMTFGAIDTLLGCGLLILKIFQYFIESQTHVQAICRDCGRLWLLN